MPSLTTLDVVLLTTHTACFAFAFAAMVRDKVAAIVGKWRTPELRLLGLNLLPGGGMGVLVAMLIVSHKTRKLRFWQSSVPSTFAWLNGLRMFMSDDGLSWLLGLVYDGLVSGFRFKHLVAGVVLAATFCLVGRSRGWIGTDKRRRRPNGIFYLIFMPPPVVRRFAELVVPITISSFAIEALLWQRS